MSVDWKILPKGDSGIYLHGSPQVQIWEKPQIGQWNTSFIRMVDDKVTVKLNGQLVVDNVTMENYWERAKPIYPTGAIELQNHGNELRFKNIYVRELPR